MRIAWLIDHLNPRIASVRYRCLLPAVGLEAHGHHSRFFTSIPDLTLELAQFDCLIVLRKRLTQRVAELLRYAQMRRIPVVLDVCDDIFLPTYGDDVGSLNAIIFKGSAGIFAAVTTTGSALVRRIEAIAPASLPILIIPDQAESRAQVEHILARFTDRRPETAAGFAFLAGMFLRTRWRTYNEMRRIGAFARYYAVAPDRARRLVVKKIRDFARRSRTHHAKKVPLNAAEAGSVRKRVVWFGNSGHGAAYSDSGMLAILRVAHHLERVNKVVPLTLTIVSNSTDRFEAAFTALPFPAQHVEWDVLGVFDMLKGADLCILPNPDDTFASSKSANRAVFALSLGVPVIASRIDALEPLRGCIGIDTWDSDIESYLTDRRRVARDIEAAQAVIQRIYAPAVVAAAWNDLLANIQRRRLVLFQKARTEPQRLLLLVDLIQDLELIIPVALAARRQPAIEALVLLTSRTAGRWLHIPRQLDELGLRYRIIDHREVLENDGVDLALGDLLLTAAETSTGPHRVAHTLAKRANALGIATFTLQHGLENVGLTYFDKTYDESVEFESNTIFCWGDPKNLPAKAPSQTRERCVGVGRTASSAATKNSLHLAPERQWIGIFENLHWHRYDDTYRRLFLSSLTELAKQRPNLGLAIRPHPAGRWAISSLRNVVNLPNILILDPADPRYATIVAADVIAAVGAVITTPSTVALDATLADRPTAVFLGGLTCDLYDPLPALRTTQDWLDFADQASLRRHDETLHAARIFRKRHLIEGDAAERIIDHIVRNHC